MIVLPPELRPYLRRAQQTVDLCLRDGSIISHLLIGASGALEGQFEMPFYNDLAKVPQITVGEIESVRPSGGQFVSAGAAAPSFWPVPSMATAPTPLFLSEQTMQALETQRQRGYSHLGRLLMAVTPTTFDQTYSPRCLADPKPPYYVQLMTVAKRLIDWVAVQKNGQVMGQWLWDIQVVSQGLEVQASDLHAVRLIHGAPWHVKLKGPWIGLQG